MERQLAEALWADESNDIRAVVANLVRRRQVVGIDAGGRYRTVDVDPEVTGEIPMVAFKGVPIEIGDYVWVLRGGGGEVIIGALPAPDGSSG